LFKCVIFEKKSRNNDLILIDLRRICATRQFGEAKTPKSELVFLLLIVTTNELPSADFCLNQPFLSRPSDNMPSLEALPISGLSEMGIKDVWAHNMEDAFRDIRRLVQKFRFIAMDTEFPGVVARPIGEFRSTSDYQYQLLRCNVDLLKIIQLGITFMDDQGKTPPVFCYQFNFKFNLTEDMYAQDSIDLLQKSGIQFKKHEEEGIDVNAFAEALMTSGVVLSEQVRWLSFHSGYDFGYMLRMLTDLNLPEEEEDFF